MAINPAEVQWDDAPAGRNRNPPATYPGAAQVIAAANDPIDESKVQWDAEAPAGGLHVDINGGHVGTPDELAAQDAQLATLRHDQAVATGRREVVDSMSNADRFVVGVGKSFDDTYRGGKQLATSSWAAQSEAAAKVLDAAGMTDAAEALRKHVTAPAATAYVGEVQAERGAREANAPLMHTGAGFAGNVAGTGVQMAAGGTALRGTEAAAMFLPRTIAGNAVQGAAMGALAPVADDSERATNIALGAGLGAATAKAGAVLGDAARSAKAAVSDSTRAVYEAAKQRGINLTAPQLTDSRFVKWMGSVLRDMPLSGGRARYAEQVARLNEKIAETIGEKAPVVNSEVYAAAKKRQSNTFDDLTSRNDMAVDGRLMTSLANIEHAAQIAPEAHQAVTSALDRLYAQAVTGPNGVIVPGPAYQAFDSALNQITKAGGVAAHYVGQVQSAVRRAMDDSIAPADRDAWAAVRREYGNRKTIAPLVAKSADEMLSPTQLMGAVTNSATAKESMASGTRGELGELAKVGQRLKEPPNSGTSPRQDAKEWFDLGRLPFKLAGLPIGATAGRLIDSETLVKLMMRENRGMTRAAAAKLLKQLAPTAGASAPTVVNAFSAAQDDSTPPPANAYAQRVGGR
jgi:hypothetical protein